MFTRLFSRTTTKNSEVEELPDTPPDLSGSPESDDSSQLETQGTPFSQLYTEAANFEKVLLHSGCINPLGVCPKGTTGFADLVGCDLTKCERALLDRDAQLHAVETPWFLPESESDDDSQEHPPIPEDFSLSHITQPDIRRASSVDNQCLTYLEPKDIVNILVREFGPVAAPGDEEKLLLEADGCLIHDIAVVVSLLAHLYYLYKFNQSIGCYSPNNPSSCLPRFPALQPPGPRFFQ